MIVRVARKERLYEPDWQRMLNWLSDAPWTWLDWLDAYALASGRPRHRLGNSRRTGHVRRQLNRYVQAGDVIEIDGVWYEVSDD